VREHTPDKIFLRARTLRKRMTNAEDILWRELRGRNFGDLKFRRQVPIGPYIADFACIQHKLIVECDGRPHDDPAQASRDARRDAWLRQQGWRILRLRIIGGGTLVLDDIRSALGLPSSASF
jgi:very-short-patch-repair endonuclease